MLYVPRHLPNKLEYKVLSCISVHYQSRMTNNGIADTPSRFHSAGRAIWGIVLCISLQCRHGSVCVGGEGILRDVPEYKCLCCIQDHHQQFIRSL